MKVVDNRKNNIKLVFADLPVGHAYLDGDGILCIKTSPYEETENCIGFVDESWNPDYQNKSDWVTPIKTTLTIEG